MTAATGRRVAQSVAADATFRALVAEQGGEVLEPTWLGSKTPHRVRCGRNHLCTPKPNKVMQGVRICTTCPGRKSSATEARFRILVAEQCGRVVGEYAGTHERIACICAAGHSCTPMPSLVLGGGGICPVCSGRCQAAADDAFRAGVAEQGGRMIGEYVNAKTPVVCICAAGHRCRSWPEVVKRGENMCRICARQDPQFAAETFRDVIALRGGRVVGEYVNSQTPVECMCPRGHLCAPLPNNIQRGQGMCPRCRGNEWDVFYVVASATRIKFGITSGDPRVRLSAHRHDGYGEVARVLVGFPEAHLLERRVRTALLDAGMIPLRGREYFDRAALAVVLDVVDGWTAAAA